ncbi:hypothetical protein Vafri_14687 [Volvox africanus]|uniref:DNA polymerase alpha subunit B n=1 Tax=Volvox africanus TaxID=51714 RepID=A0A8J4BJC7_9CHLO|nr:hypothetical protein Vafri_14687 [Volvox africanus]
MAAATGHNQQTALERAFASKSYKFGDSASVARAQQLAQQLHLSAESFANQYDSFALISDWSMDVTAQRLKMVADYLESEQRKENSRPRVGPGGTGGSAIKAVPQAAKPTWEDLPDKLEYPTPSAKRQALDPNAVNPGTASKEETAIKPSTGRPGTAAATGTPQAAARQLPGGGLSQGWGTSTPMGTRPVTGTPSTQPPSAFALRANQGQVVAVLHEHLPGPATYCQLHQRGANVPIRPLGQPALDAGGLLFMMEVLETKVHALDERIMDFAESLTAATRRTASSGTSRTQNGAAGTPGCSASACPPTPVSMPNSMLAPGGTPLPTAQAAVTSTPGAIHTPVSVTTAPTTAERGEAPGVAEPLQHSVADMSHQPVWVAGRVLAETEGAPLNAESLLLEGCRDASGGARVRLDVSCLPAYRLFPGQSVCAYGLNPTGGKFIAQRLVTHVPPPPLALTGPDAAAVRQSGLSLVVAAGPYCLTEELLYSPLEELLSYCTAQPPDVLLLLGPFVDSEHPGVAAGGGIADRTADSLMREEVLRRLAGWRSDHPSATVALMPAVRDLTALPVLPQPSMTAAAQALGPPDKAVALQNPSTVSMGPLVVAGCSADVLKALSASEHSRVPPGTAVERLPALASHVLGQRSFYPLYPAAPGTCLDTSHYSQLQLPVMPDVLLMPSDLAPFAKVLQPAAWMAGGPPGLEVAAAAPGSGKSAAGAPAVSAAPVVVINPGRLSRGTAGGTFAHVVVSPGGAPVLERIRAEVKRV